MATLFGTFLWLLKYNIDGWGNNLRKTLQYLGFWLVAWFQCCLLIGCWRWRFFSLGRLLVALSYRAGVWKVRLDTGPAPFRVIICTSSLYRLKRWRPLTVHTLDPGGSIWDCETGPCWGLFPDLSVDMTSDHVTCDPVRPWGIVGKSQEKMAVTFPPRISKAAVRFEAFKFTFGEDTTFCPLHFIGFRLLAWTVAQLGVEKLVLSDFAFFPTLCTSTLYRQENNSPERLTKVSWVSVFSICLVWLWPQYSGVHWIL